MTPALIPVIVAGPTGVGKSHFAVELAEQLDGEIIGADAFQIYAGLARLTAQPEAELRARVPHHLIGIAPPCETFNVARFLVEANRIVAEVQARGKRPILCGGTGLYLKAFTHGLSVIPPTDVALRAELEMLTDAELMAELQRLDAAALAVIDLKNRRRVLRAVEICRMTGRPVTEIRRQWESTDREFIALKLNRERDDLRERIRQNVEQMFALGVEEEVRQLGELGDTAAKAIGLTEIQRRQRGEISLERCQELMVNATRQYAKRQLTWFRSQTTYSGITLASGKPLADSLQTARRLVI